MTCVNVFFALQTSTSEAEPDVGLDSETDLFDLPASTNTSIDLSDNAVCKEVYFFLCHLITCILDYLLYV